MNLTFFRVALAMLWGTGVGMAQTPALIPVSDLVIQQDFVFGKGGDVDLHADLGYPKNAKAPTPAIIFVHGGGWIGGSYKSNDGTALQAAQRGYFAMTIQYRLSNQAKWPAQLQDCQQAVRWLRANAAKYNVDPNRIGVWGSSAGGHLVACLATMADVAPTGSEPQALPGVSNAVQAVVDFFGPTDFTRPEIYSPDAIKLSQGLFGTPRDADPALWKSGSPVFFVKSGNPPVLMIHGDADPLVPIGQSKVFQEALTRAGVPNELIVVHNGNHGLQAPPGQKISPDWHEINERAWAFLDKNLKPAAVPAAP